MTHIEIAGRSIPLVFDLNVMEQLEQRFGAPLDLSGILQKLMQTSVLLSVVEIMAAEGQDIERAKDPVDRTWLGRHARPGQIVDIAKSVVDEVNQAMTMETETDGGEDEEVDVVLEELKKKEPTGG